MTTQAFRKRAGKANGNVGWAVVRSIVAMVLLIAAGFKAHQLATVPTLGDGLFDARWFQILLVYCELALAVLLLGSMAPKISWLISTVLFSVFTAVSLAKGISGNESCGCFGAATVNPWLTFVMDAGIVTALIIFRPMMAVFHWKIFKREFYRVWQSKRVIAVVIVYLLLAVPATYAMMSVKKNDLTELGTEFIGADGKKTILLEPEKWIERPFPLISRFAEPDGSEILKQGTWHVLLIHTDCPKCLQMKAGLEARNAKKIAIVVVPSRPNERMPDSPFPVLGLDDLSGWFVSTPCVVKLVDGICVATGEDVME